jgi:flagellar basal body-associated protein FliL
LLIIIIIILALLVIAGSFFFLFKNKKKNGKSKNDKDQDNHGVAISHEDDEELLEYTKEFTEFPNNLNDQIRKDNDYDKL